LTGFETHLRWERRSKAGALPLVTVVCLVLLALLAVAQVAHLHTSDIEADRCPLCIVMHTAAPVAVMAVAVVMVQVGTPEPLVEVRTVVLHRHPKLFTRPPPVGC
jgi:uncharacterized membrane protein YqhA